MGYFARLSIRHAASVIILMILIMIAGVYSMFQFKQETNPSVSIPYLVVSSVYPGASPQKVQSEVAIPLEQALKGEESIRGVYSDSHANLATLRIEFEYGEDMADKRDRIWEVLSEVNLPEGAEKPDVTMLTMDTQPILNGAVTAERGTDFGRLQTFVEKEVLPSLQSLEGVREVQLTGMGSNEIQILPDMKKMKKKQVTMGELNQALQDFNVSVPVGQAQLEQGVKPVQFHGRADSVETLESLAIKPATKLKDIAQVKEVSGEKEVLCRVKGLPGIEFKVVKEKQANVNDVSDRVIHEMKRLNQSHDNMHLDMIYNSSVEVENTISEMLNKSLLGMVIASLVVLVFLRNLRSTLIAIITIPLSILLAVAVLKAITDITMNVLTLAAIAVSVGRVLDDSIVVLENIIRRMQSEKLTPDLAADATREVGKAVTASTLTTVVVFAPIGLLGGMAGEITRPFAWVVTVSLLASLLVAVTVVPMLAFHLLRKSTPKVERRNKISMGYRKVLKWSLNHKGRVLIVSGLLLILSLPLSLLTGITFMLEQDEKYMMINLTLPKETKLSTLTDEAIRLDNKLLKEKEIEISQVTIGSPKGEYDPLTLSHESTKASWLVKLSPDTDVNDFIKKMRGKLKPNAKGASLSIQDLANGSGLSASIGITVTGKTEKEIEKATEKITKAVQGVKGTEEVGNTLVQKMEGIDLIIRQQDSLQHGLTATETAALIRPFLSKTEVGTIGDVPVTMDMGVETVKNSEDIGDISLLSTKDKTIRLHDIAEVKDVQYPALLQLKDGKKYATVTGDITDVNVGQVNQNIEKAIEKLDLPDGVQVMIGGSNEQISESLQDFGIVILIAIGVIYMILLVTFRGGKAPFAILFSLPFASTGALLGTFLSGQPASAGSLIGIMMLVGIVVTNAIVLVDRIQQQVDGGLTVREALLEAGTTRLRPVLMTALTTIGALLPLAMGMGDGILISQGLAVVVVGGLITSTLLTLVIVPIIYELLHRNKTSRQNKKTEGAVEGRL